MAYSIRTRLQMGHAYQEWEQDRLTSKKAALIAARHKSLYTSLPIVVVRTPSEFEIARFQNGVRRDDAEGSQD